MIFFEALWVKIRDEGRRNKAAYVALGVLPDATREVSGLWIAQTEGAKCWLKVFNAIKTRGGQDVRIAVADGLTGLGGAVETAFPKTTVQTCIVHLLRNSLEYASGEGAGGAGLRPASALHGGLGRGRRVKP